MILAVTSGAPRLQNVHSSFAAREYWKTAWSTPKASRWPSGKLSIAAPTRFTNAANWPSW